MRLREKPGGLSYQNDDLIKLFRSLFLFLDSVGYCWQPMIPERLLKTRIELGKIGKLEQYFGLGLPSEAEQLEAEGLPVDLIERLNSLKLAVSRVGAYYVPHNHWPSENLTADQYVHFGQESILFIHQLYRYWETFKNKRILDFGCSGGGITQELGQVGKYVLGLDRCERAVEWARASALAQRSEKTSFIQMDIQDLTSTPEKITQNWGVVVFNPPMILPKREQILLYRDGGELGLETPLLFLDAAEKVLEPFGEVFCLMTNPIKGGKALLFERLATKNWSLLERLCLNYKFNYQLYKEDEYTKSGIDRVELYFMHLKKNY